jgi:hypothetical protein
MLQKSAIAEFDFEWDDFVGQIGKECRENGFGLFEATSSVFIGRDGDNFMIIYNEGNIRIWNFWNINRPS